MNQILSRPKGVWSRAGAPQGSGPEVLMALPSPQLNPACFHLVVLGAADGCRVEIFDSSSARVVELRVQGPAQAGWIGIGSLPALAPGRYSAQASAWRGGETGRLALCSFSVD